MKGNLMSTSTSRFCRTWQPIPLGNIKSVDLHFKLPGLDLLPDDVYLGIPQDYSESEKDSKKTTKNGSMIFFEVGVALPQLFFSLEQNGFPNVGFRGDWVQCGEQLNDKFSVHFCFVSLRDVDLYRAMKHDGLMARQAFENLSAHRWNVSGFSNDNGSFDFTFHRPRNQPGGSALLVDQDFLGLH